MKGSVEDFQEIIVGQSLAEKGDGQSLTHYLFAFLGFEVIQVFGFDDDHILSIKKAVLPPSEEVIRLIYQKICTAGSAQEKRSESS